MQSKIVANQLMLTSVCKEKEMNKTKNKENKRTTLFSM